MRWIVGSLIVAGFVAGYLIGAFGEGASGGRGTRAAAVVVPDPGGLDLNRMVATLESDEPVRGAGVISGRATDLRGRPLSGVLIVAEPFAEEVWSKSSKIPVAPPVVSLERQVREYAARTAGARRRSRRARTGNDGTYLLPGLPDGKYLVRAYAEGHRVDTQRGHFQAVAESGDSVDFVARAIARIPVAVTFEDGSVPERAWLRWKRTTATGGSRAASEDWTTRSPWIELEEGNYTLSASAADRSRAQSAPSSFSVRAGVEPPEVSFRIERKPGLRVTAVPPEGFAKIGPKIYVMRFSGAEPPAEDLLRSSRVRSHDDSNHRNVTRYFNLEPGRYLVGAERSAGAGFCIKQVVDVTRAAQEVTLQLPEPDPAHHLLVRATDPEGTTLPRVGWGMAHHSQYGWRHYGAKGWRRDDGVTFVVIPAEVKGVEGERLVTARHDSYGFAEAAIAGAGVTTLRFAEPAFVDATLEGYAGSGFEGRFDVYIHHPHLGYLARGKQPDGKGAVQFGPLQPGSYLLGLDKPDALHGNPKLAAEGVTLRSGRQRVSLAIPPLHSLRVRWRGEGKPGYILRGLDDSSAMFHAAVDDEGTGLFRDVPPGRYVIHVANLKQEIPDRVVTIPGTSEVTLP